MKRFAVFGNPIEHSRSPEIHQAFAAERGIEIEYQRILAPLDQFNYQVRRFFDEGGEGANVTLPFKEQAFELCDQLTERARQAGAVNTLWMKHDALHGDNTDGIGLVTDIRHNLGWQLHGKRILILGAGGAVRGVVGPLIAETPAEICIANRTVEKANAIVDALGNLGVPLYAQPLAELTGEYDVMINAISAGLAGEMPALPEKLFAADAVAYDMVYTATGNTPFTDWAELHGAVSVSDGLGMLVEQAAEAFHRWHPWRPNARAVIHQLRESLKK